MAGPRWWTSVRGRPSYRGPAPLWGIPSSSACRQRSPLLTTPQCPCRTIDKARHVFNDLQWLVLQERSEAKSGAGEEAGQQRRAVLHPSQAALHQRGQLGDGVLGQVGQRLLQVRPDQLDRVEL